MPALWKPLHPLATLSCPVLNPKLISIRLIMRLGARSVVRYCSGVNFNLNASARAKSGLFVILSVVSEWLSEDSTHESES